MIWYARGECILFSLVPRPSLALPAFNIARKKKREEEEGLVRDVTHERSRISERGRGGAALTTKMHSKWCHPRTLGLAISGHARKYHGSWEVSKGYLLTVQKALAKATQTSYIYSLASAPACCLACPHQADLARIWGVWHIFGGGVRHQGYILCEVCMFILHWPQECNLIK
jgi:hypothetical protein